MTTIETLVLQLKSHCSFYIYKSFYWPFGITLKWLDHSLQPTHHRCEQILFYLEIDVNQFVILSSNPLPSGPTYLLCR